MTKEDFAKGLDPWLTDRTQGEPKAVCAYYKGKPLSLKLGRLVFGSIGGAKNSLRIMIKDSYKYRHHFKALKESDYQQWVKENIEFRELKVSE